ncbi:MAG TPA: alpha/beta hydrolase [Kiritimatiellia bacterium]|nr:alpha/beta hydrolase [Kiritimatiellia bacterium]
MCGQQPFFLFSPGRALSATRFVPETLRGAVLFVPPFYEERKGALPAFTRTARALAEHQIASLLFDFSGCGDSAGDFGNTDPEWMEEDAETALTWLRNALPGLPVALLGLRTGAVLAARLAARHPESALLVGWSPTDGPTFIRQLLQRRMVNDMTAYGKARESRAALEERLRHGDAVDLDGYVMTGAFHAWLQCLLPPALRIPVRLFSGGHDPAASRTFAAQAVHAECSELRFPPFWNTVGQVDLTALTDETVACLSACLSGPTRPAKSFPALADCPDSTAEAACLTLPVSPKVRAMLDLPRGTPRAGALFLHGWSGDRTGPHRLFTRFGRLLAAQGTLCLRPDFAGRGLSGGRPEEASIAGMAEGAQAALAALRGRLPPGTPISVVAICSGCKVAITLAAGNPDLANLLLWSPESMGSLRSGATGWRKTRAALLAYARKLTRPETWRKILTGRVRTDLVTRALVRHATRSAEEAVREDATLARFRAFRNPLLLVFGGSDPDAPGSRTAYTRYCRTNAIPCRTHTIPHAGHSYYGEAWTQELFEVSLAFLQPDRDLPTRSESDAEN